MSGNEIEELVSYYEKAMEDGKVTVFEVIGIALRLIKALGSLISLIHSKIPGLPSLGSEKENGK